MRSPAPSVLERARALDVSTRGVLAGGGVELRQPTDLTEANTVQTIARTAHGLLGLWNSTVALRPLDVRVYMFVLTRWMDQLNWDTRSAQNALEVPACFTLTELLTWLRGGTDFGGAAYQEVAESLGRLFDAEISGHYEYTDQKAQRLKRVRMKRSRLLADLEIEAQTLAATVDAAERDRLLGAQRHNTVRAMMSPWTLQQVREGELVSVEIELLRQLGGMAERLWLLLVSLLGVSNTEDLVLPVGEKLSATLGINYARNADLLKALRRSAKRVEQVDKRFVDVKTVKRDGKWFLQATVDRNLAERRARETQQQIDDRQAWGRMAPKAAQMSLLPEGGTSPD